MRAWNLTRPEIVYRHDAFSAGLRTAGYEIQSGTPTGFRPGDVVLGWHRYGPNVPIAAAVERAGGVYLCAENGYLGPGGVSPHHMEPRGVYALGRGWHNDATVVREGGPERFDALGVTLAPWRTAGEHVLVCGNRPFGHPLRAMPAEWPHDVRKRLEKLTKREIRVRPHPGNDAPRKPLAEDLAGAHACVIWSSSAGVHALVAGVPVICDAPFWICRKASSTSPWGHVLIDDIAMNEEKRLKAMQRLAWAQWSLAEIQSGEAFAHLLRPARQVEVAASA